ncbi:hypothetical protein [Colwellia sp. UCD-KL20]|uniref:hypothetical protein n=1 Tax=Colwellia sp. UCD-KL20 TaxID=1917165 RepID=UPI0009710E14|nr:hypothetical protein [Colwellia sp. UCD-KL20]
MNNYSITIYCFYFAILGTFTLPVQALPKVNIEHSTNLQGAPRIKITNETALTLACYIAIDGHKKKFILEPFKASRWYSAASHLYDQTSFSTWCDSLEFHPHYQKYRQ